MGKGLPATPAISERHKEREMKTQSTKKRTYNKRNRRQKIDRGGGGGKNAPWEVVSAAAVEQLTIGTKMFGLEK